MIIWTILLFLFVLGLLVFVHELGHFVMAKKAGMKVEEFGFGFPPRIKGFKRGETTYSINWIPLGGFVKILGEDGTARENPQSFASKSALRRLAVLVAGVTMNMVLAAVLLSVNNIVGVPTAIGDDDDVEKARVQITSVVTDSPAGEAGIKLGDSILSVNNEPITKVARVQEIVQQEAGKPATVLIERGKEELSLTLEPRENPPDGQGALGIGLARTTLVRNPWYMAPIYGIRDTGLMSKQIGLGFIGLVRAAVHDEGAITDSIAGPIGIAALTKQVSTLGVSYLIQFTALLSINLAFINILPLPALDGGRIIFVLIEKIKGSPVSKEKEGLIHTIGFAALLLLMAVITFFDVLKFKDGIADAIRSIFT